MPADFAVARRGCLLKSRVCKSRVAAAVGENPEARRYFVSGIVQGVGFRYFAHRAARTLGVAGYAKNLADGRVEVYAIGSPEKLTALRAELERGPRSASVSGVAEEDARIDPQFAGGFSIEPDAW
jgi:acylphosphatase